MRVRLVLAAAAIALVATTAPAPASAATAWWAPIAFTGHDVSDVFVAGGVLVATVDGTRMVSTDGGASFVPASSAAAAPAPVEPAAVLTTRTFAWTIDHGRVLTGPNPAALQPDPRAPFLGAGARYIAAPGAMPGVVLAAGSDGHVWRRDSNGDWATALVLLPAGGFSGPPPVTGLQAFTEPLSYAIYLATDGEGVLLTTDAGADWTRTDGAGLPDNVHAIAASNNARSLYAATGDGLWVHVLQSFPAPPAYTDASFWLRWLGIGGIALAAAAAAVVVLRRAVAPATGPPGS